jgi:hypothetical protein
MRASDKGYPHFAPVIIGDACRGHLLASARGWRAFDREDREVGTYPSPEAAISALLKAAAA